MKRRLNSITAGILALLMLASCASETADPGSADVQPEAAADAETVPAAEETEDPYGGVKDNLPDSLNYQGQAVTWMYANDSVSAKGISADDDGEVVNSAVVRRNQTVEDRLNVELKFLEHQYEADAVKNTLLAGTTEFQLMRLMQYRHVPLMIEGLYYDMTDAPYLDYDQPWWDKDVMYEMSPLGNTVYFLLGDLTWNYIDRTGCMFFNKALYTDVFRDAEDQYEQVLQGKWTLDVLAQNSEIMYKDTNGDGIKNIDDTIGYGIFPYWVIEMIHYGGGVSLSYREADGYPVYDPATELSVSVMDKVLGLVYNNAGGYLYDYNTEHTPIMEKFMGGTVGYYFGLFGYAKSFREMESDYGIIPYPKNDESVENYRSLITDDLSVQAVPYSLPADQLEITCAVLEAMASEGYRQVRPAYYEVALKSKYTRDERSGQVVDMIYDSAYTEFGYIFNSGMGGIISRNIVADGTNTLASRSKSAKKLAERYIKELIVND